MVKRRRRSNGPLIAWISVGVVVALVLTFVLVKELQTTTPQSALVGQQTSQQVFNEVTQVPASVFNAVGVTSPAIQVSPPGLKTKQAPLTIAGLPGSFYYGAEFCPYCAATRWGIIVALSRFGSFNKLYNMWSSATDPAGPNTPTFTFDGVTYTSSHLSFTGYEVEDRNGQPLMTLPSDLQTLVTAYNPSENFPFMDMGNKVFILQSAFNPLQLQGFKTQQSIAVHLDDPGNYVTQAIITTANYVSAGLCQIAKDPPASVCHSAGVEAAMSALGLSH